jgi:hypothetical protein
MNRRQFIINSFKVGGIAALYNLGLSPKAIASWQDDLIGVISQKNTSVPPGCTKGAAIYSEATETNGAGVGADAIGQQFTPSGDCRLYSFEIVLGGISTGGNFTLRLGTSTDLTSYIEELTGSYPNGGGTVEIISVLNPYLTGSTTYYFGIIKTSGTTMMWRYNSAGSGGGVVAGSGWTMGGIGGHSKTGAVYKCA